MLIQLQARLNILNGDIGCELFVEDFVLLAVEFVKSEVNAGIDGLGLHQVWHDGGRYCYRLPCRKKDRPSCRRFTFCGLCFYSIGRKIVFIVPAGLVKI